MKDPLLLAFLTLVWLGLTGAYLTNVVVGLLVAWFVMWWVPDVPELEEEDGGVWRRLARGARSVPPALVLAAVFLSELCLSSLRVAREVLRPRLAVRPGVLHVEVDARSDLELTVFAGLLSLTPGSLCVDVDEGRRGVFVHVMYVRPDDVAATRRQIRDLFWPHVVRALRAGDRPAPDGAPWPGPA